MKFTEDDINGDLIKKYRESKTPKLTQQELADQLDVNRVVVTRWENNE